LDIIRMVARRDQVARDFAFAGNVAEAGRSHETPLQVAFTTGFNGFAFWETVCWACPAVMAGVRARAE